MIGLLTSLCVGIVCGYALGYALGTWRRRTRRIPAFDFHYMRDPLAALLTRSERRAVDRRPN